MKTYAIGDLHGRFDLLCKAIDLIEADSPSGGRFIVLGDFIDRGPQARNVIDLLMAGPQVEGWEWIVLQGNHEDIMLQCLDNPNILGWWFRNGGVQTLISYGYADGDDLLPLKVPKAHLDWLRGLPITFEDDHRIFVHAGVPLHLDLENADKETLQWMLYVGEEEEGQVTFDGKWHSGAGWHVSGKHIVHGHHQDARNPRPNPARTNLDSYAWLTGRTAIGVFDDTQSGPTHILEVKGPAAK